MSNKGISRREFLAISGLAGAFISVSGSRGISGAIAQAMMGGGGMMGGGMIGGGGGDVIVIDPPVGDLLKDPLAMPNLSTTPGVVEVGVEMKVAPININGTTANLLTYNGYFPQQVISVSKGDKLRVHFKNSAPSVTETNLIGYLKYKSNTHTHGWRVSPAGNADNQFLHFMPFPELPYEHDYEYDTSEQEAGTLGFYHPHSHGTVAEQMWTGLGGCPLIVNDDITTVSDFETHILLLKDISLSGSAPALYTYQDYIRGKEGNVVMVNGQVNPVLHIRPGQVQRWRIINESQARYYRLSLESHTMYIVGTDGGLLDRPYAVNDILLPPGERVDMLVRATRGSGIYRLLSLPYNRGGNQLQQITLLTLSYQGTGVSNRIPSSINPNAERLDVNSLNIAASRTFTLSMMMGTPTINGRNFTTDPLTVTSNVGTYEVWEFVNQSMMDHPMHIHLNPFQVLSISGGLSSYSSLYTTTPSWKDTINVPAMGGRVRVLLPVLYYTGRTVFHCHIVEHEDIGMMAIWDIV